MSDSATTPAADAGKPVQHSHEFRVLETVLNSLDALVYVSDMQTAELLFVNQYGRNAWGELDERKCYQYLQAGQAESCKFCTNDKLVDANGKPTGVLVWEIQNSVTHRWYQCRDQAIPWVDGRLVRLEIAVDITDSKLVEQQLRESQHQAEELARVDPLTKVYNRRAFDEHMERIYRDLQRKSAPMCLVMLDLDLFKRINDTYGHAFGDQVLISVCQRLRADLRESDLLFRIGGEEFVITLLNCDIAVAIDLVERLRRHIESMSLYAGDTDVKLTCSFGIAPYDPNVSIAQLLANADAALYAAKQGGRNRVCIADGHTY